MRKNTMIWLIIGFVLLLVLAAVLLMRDKAKNQASAGDYPVRVKSSKPDSESAAKNTIHISPQGDDAAFGAADTPIRTLARLEALLGERTNITEVVFHGGVYPGTLTVRAPQGADAEKLSPLLLRAADGEEPIIDAALRLPAREAEPIAGAPGVYRLAAAPFRTEANVQSGLIPPMWDTAVRKRYILVADLLAVKQFPASYTFTSNSLYFHTANGRPPAENSIDISGYGWPRGGLRIARFNVTVRGLIARNCMSDMFSVGFHTAPGVERVTFEDCRAFNCSRGFIIHRGRHMRLLRCRAENVGCGVLINGQYVSVEGGVFLHGPRDDFMVPMPDPQEETGIEVYHPAGEEIVIRENVIKGFMFCGIFFKCLPGKFTVERNTLVDNTIGIGWAHGRAQVFARDNIMYGGSYAIRGQVQNQAIVKLQADGNILWPAPWSGERVMRDNLDYLNSTGKGNILADPRLAAPEANDFRLLPNSPCVNRGGTGRQIGALGMVPPDFRDVHPPLLDLAEQPALVSVKDDVDASPLFVTFRRDFPLRVRAYDAAGKVTQMCLRIGDEPWGDPLPYTNDIPVRLPADAGVFTVSVRVADDAGNWSEPVAIRARAAVAPPKLVEEPTIRTNRHGVVISFRTDVECHAGGEFGSDRNYGTPLLLSGTTRPGDKGPAAREHVLGALRSEQGTNRSCYFRVRLANHDGKTGHEFTGAFSFTGEPQSYHVDPAAVDVENGGTAARPWRTLQYAVDRALPGDRVIAMPGLYPEGARITRGGVEGAPLVIQARDKWKTVVDGRNQMRGRALFHVENASRVEIVGMELRWFGNRSFSAIRLDSSPNVTVRECKIWNELCWGEARLGGVGIVVNRSPGFVLEKSLLFRLDYAMTLSDSPRSRIIYNTFRAFSHGCLTLNGSTVNGTVVRNNSINYPGNYVYEIHVSNPTDMETFSSDYNNLGTRIRDEFWRDEPGVVSNLPSAVGAGKAVAFYGQSGATCLKEDEPTPDDKKKKGWKGRAMARYKWVPNATTPLDEQAKNSPYFPIGSFEDWQAFSGQDTNSIWADPRHRNTLEFDFRLLPDSPNIGAGENGTTIGAMPVYQPGIDDVP